MDLKKRAVACTSYRPGMYGPGGPNKGVPMILSFFVSIKMIVEMGREFPWPRPGSCPRCKSNRVWGHGFEGVLFDGFVEQVMLRRWRCPDCRCVMRARPAGYFPRVGTPIEQIRSSIAFRVRTGRWPPGPSRTMQGHWLGLCVAGSLPIWEPNGESTDGGI